LIGQPAEISAFKELADGEVSQPAEGSSCQWITVPDSSPMKGKMLSLVNINQQYRVQIQALRRKGEFIQFPAGGVELKGGDRLLLCGVLSDLQAISNAVQGPLPALVPLVSSVAESVEA
jgi:monovalent cation:H+ antiporter-2, CPA2 family